MSGSSGATFGMTEGTNAGFNKQVDAVMRAVRGVTDPRYMKKLAKKNRNCWGGYLLVAFTLVGIFVTLSSSHWSFLLVLSVLATTLCFGTLAFFIWRAKSCQGISVKMIELYVVIYCLRLPGLMISDNYLPIDDAATHVYRPAELLTFFFNCGILYMCRVLFRESYDPDLDTFASQYILLVGIILGLAVTPSLGLEVTDLMWGSALYIESLATLPQLFMFQKEGEVHEWTAHFLVVQAICKAFSMVFFSEAASELSTPDHPIRCLTGPAILCAQGFQLLTMCDFLYHYARCVRKGIPVTMMMSDNV